MQVAGVTAFAAVAGMSIPLWRPFIYLLWLVSVTATLPTVEKLMRTAAHGHTIEPPIEIPFALSAGLAIPTDIRTAHEFADHHPQFSAS